MSRVYKEEMGGGQEAVGRWGRGEERQTATRASAPSERAPRLPYALSSQSSEVQRGDY